MTKHQPIKSKNSQVYIESYGCQMNFSDSEIVASILTKEGHQMTKTLENADLVLLNTCSIREKAEQTLRHRLLTINNLKQKKPKMKIGILGCMAERLKTKLLEDEKTVDLVVGPDSYKDLPRLLEMVNVGNDAINVQLSLEETYGDISPIRLDNNGVNAFVTITRGCDNMCTFCVVPFTRGRERSRNPKSIRDEIQDLEAKGYKELTLLGQNVDSYLWYGGGSKKQFKNASDLQKALAVSFSDLLADIAESFPNMRIRFTTSNPQDMDIEVLKNMAKYPNICNHIHLPVQSGSDRILGLMNRQHSRLEYMELIDNIRTYIPDCAISHDMITGFPSETAEDHKDTLSLMEYVKYDFGFMFAYSERPGTLAHRKLKDDIAPEVKKRRLQEIIKLQQKHSRYRLGQWVGKTTEVLIEKASKKSDLHWMGRNSQNMAVVFPKSNLQIGQKVNVNINSHTSATLIGTVVSDIISV